MALATAVIGDIVGMYGIIAFEAAKQGEFRPMAAVGYIHSLIVFFIAIFGGSQMLMFWIIKRLNCIFRPLCFRVFAGAVL
ncbi:hypothetical protein Hanom_Chr16g01431661 [Helianthus anomalus]